MPTRDPKLPGLTIVLPCLDEAANIEQAVGAARAAAAAVAHDHEVIVVDDGSSDGSAVIVASLAAADPHVRLLVHGQNRGYGSAMRSGIAAARMPWILLTDADLQFDLAELRDFVPLTQDADLLIGWRIARNDPLNRRLNAAAWNWLVRRLFHLRVRDVDCAFKLMRAEVVKDIPLTSRGAMFSTELLVRSLAAGARLQELGVHHLPRSAGSASGARPHVILTAFRELLDLRRMLPGGTTTA